MATFRRGLDAEDRICTKLEGFGCRIQRDPRLDHKHKLDFVITNYIDNPNFYSLGVQITTKLDVLEKQEEFLRANHSSRVTTKSLYLELSDKLDLDDGGALAVLTVILEFQFNRGYTNVKLAAGRIYEDMTYQFYDLPARVKQLRERLEEQQFRSEIAGSFAPKPVSPVSGGTAAMPSTPSTGPTLVVSHGEQIGGTIDSYVRQGGHGIIQAEGENRYFFHISHVVDEGLRDQLNALPTSTLPARLYVGVDFNNAGFTNLEHGSPEARNVRLGQVTEKRTRMENKQDTWQLSVEDQLVFDILGQLNRVPLSQRESILATVGGFVVSEQDALEEEMKRKLITKLTGMGCRVEGSPFQQGPFQQSPFQQG